MATEEGLLGFHRTKKLQEIRNFQKKKEEQKWLQAKQLQNQWIGACGLDKLGILSITHPIAGLLKWGNGRKKKMAA